MNGSRILVTGAGGFVGQALCMRMQEKGIDFVPVTRRPVADAFGSTLVRNIDASTNWLVDLDKVDVVVHLAARVHMVRDASPDPLRDYRAANVEATLNLARQCAAAGVQRFIYLSSIKVNGESTGARPFASGDPPSPADPYGISKWEAEQGLRALAKQTGLGVVILRPPLVYGPNVKANFLQLMRWVRRGIPLPLASVDNRRSMIYVGNLVDVILRCLSHAGAEGQAFLVSDDHDVSVAELIRSIAFAMGQSPRLFRFPPRALLMAAGLLGRQPMAERLLQSLQVDIGLTRQRLQWTPPHSFADGIGSTVRHFLATHGARSRS